MKLFVKDLKEDKFHIMKRMQSTITVHSHDYYELVYIKKGKITHIFNNNKVEVCEGEYFIIDIENTHGYEKIPGEECEIINCLFYPEFIDRTLKACNRFSLLIENYLIKFNESILKYNPTTYLYKDEDKKIISVLNDMLSEREERRHGFYELMRCKLIEILIITMRKIIDDEKYIEKNSPTQFIIKYVKENYASKISLSQIGRELNYSLPYVSLKFKEDTGMLFSEYLQKIRIDESCRLLANTQRKISDISLAVGYDDVKFFNKTFKKFINITPSAFRKMQQNNN